MKKVLLIAAGLMLSATTFAQEEAAGNKMWIGGSAGFTSSGNKDKADETKDISSFQYNVGPTFGYMLNDKAAIGLNMNFYSSSSTRNNATEDKTVGTGYNFEPFFRYYFAGKENFKFYGDLAVSFGGGKTVVSDNDVNNEDAEYKTGTFGVGTYIGAQYWFTPNWSIASSTGLLVTTVIHLEKVKQIIQEIR